MFVCVKVTDPREPELQLGVVVWVLGIEPVHSGRKASALDLQTILLAD